MKGRKRKPTSLRLIDGGAGHRPIPEGEPVPVGAVERPARLKGRAGALWDSVIARAFWLTWADGAKALMWCYLQAEFDASPANMLSSRIAQLRGVASDLGLDPASRARLGVQQTKPVDDPADRYLE